MVFNTTSVELQQPFGPLGQSVLGYSGWPNEAAVCVVCASRVRECAWCVWGVRGVCVVCAWLRGVLSPSKAPTLSHAPSQSDPRMEIPPSVSTLISRDRCSRRLWMLCCSRDCNVLHVYQSRELVESMINSIRELKCLHICITIVQFLSRNDVLLGTAESCRLDLNAGDGKGYTCVNAQRKMCLNKLPN
jgi:hypothetical protein